MKLDVRHARDLATGVWSSCDRYDVSGRSSRIPILLRSCHPVCTSFSIPLSISTDPFCSRMEFIFGNLNGGSSQFNEDIVRCPFLRHINKPTHFSFTASTALPIAVQDGKGPIFEDGPNFDMAFRLFHGQNGVVPLSGGLLNAEKSPLEQSPAQFNPLAAKAATISLSGFGPGGPFGFDTFSEMWKKQNKKSKESSSKGENSDHEAMGDEWLQNGNCPMAKSYRAVSNVLPFVAKALQPPPGMKYRCPPAIVAARSALAKTAFAKNLRPQPLPAKILVIGVLGMAANIPLGIWREHTEKFSPSWFAAVHAAVPFIAMLRKSVLMPKTAMAFTIAASILGQVIGSRAERHRLKAITTKKQEAAETDQLGTGDGLCREKVEWHSNTPLQGVLVASSSTNVFG